MLDKKHYEAIKDTHVNLDNRNHAIDEYGYGPINPQEKSAEFWNEKAKMWKSSVEEAKKSRCYNCAAFNQTPEVIKAMGDALGPVGDKIVEKANLGYCEFFYFKCAGERTCDAWVVNGPLKEGIADKLGAFGRGFADKATLGGYKYARAAVDYGAKKALKGLGLKGGEDTTYERELDQEKEKLSKDYEKEPLASAAGDIAGHAMPYVPVVGAAIQAAKGAVDTAKGYSDKAAPVADKLRRGFQESLDMSRKKSIAHNLVKKKLAELDMSTFEKERISAGRNVGSSNIEDRRSEKVLPSNDTATNVSTNKPPPVTDKSDENLDAIGAPGPLPTISNAASREMRSPISSERNMPGPVAKRMERISAYRKARNMDDLDEDIANAAGGGNIAGIGVGPQGEPGITVKRQKKNQEKNAMDSNQMGAILGLWRRQTPQIMEAKELDIERKEKFNYETGTKESDDLTNRRIASGSLEHIDKIGDHDIHYSRHNHSYTVRNRKTGIVDATIAGQTNEFADVPPKFKKTKVFHIRATDSTGDGPKMHKVYHKILKSGHSVALVGSSHSEGGKRIWKNLSRMQGITAHGWHPKKGAVNIDPAKDEEDTWASSREAREDSARASKEPDPKKAAKEDMGASDIIKTKLVASYNPPKPRKRIIRKKLAEQSEKMKTLEGEPVKGFVVEKGKFAGHDTFIVPSDLFHNARMQKKKGAHWTKYVGSGVHAEAIRQHAKSNYGKPIILQDEKTGAMCYAAYGKK